MKAWQRRVQELENGFNSFKESTTERLDKTGERFEAYVNRIEGLETRTVELESKITPINCQNPQVSCYFLIVFLNFSPPVLICHSVFF
jgi:hypothetical protein